MGRWHGVCEVNEFVDVVFSGLSPLVIEGVADEGELILVRARTPQDSVPCPGCGVAFGPASVATIPGIRPMPGVGCHGSPAEVPNPRTCCESVNRPCSANCVPTVAPVTTTPRSRPVSHQAPEVTHARGWDQQRIPRSKSWRTLGS